MGVLYSVLLGSEEVVPGAGVCCEDGAEVEGVVFRGWEGVLIDSGVCCGICCC